MKICCAASSGGHLDEMLSLFQWNTDHSFLITERTAYEIDGWQSKVYYFGQTNRRDKFLLLKLAVVFCKTISVFFREKPDVVVSTGALMTVPVCLVGRLLGKKIIYIESVARVKTASATGKLIYRFADLFIIQWESLKGIYPEAVYGGRVL